ncbi:hypothetical protein CE91St41_08040 [Oscillospiraceae bacterium]|nr:hypothetical protein CE91St40_08040 [Oscillospiraceae bacterium]BDF73915.1 hypothetical protein CE91St41_08040 [Oscillospiraceae bacterium]
MAGKRVKPSSRRPAPARRAGRALYRTLVVLSAVIVALFCAYKLASKQPTQAPAMSTPKAVRPTDNPDTGEREDLADPVPALERKPYTYTVLLACSDATSGNADTIMVAMYDTVNQQAGLVSIPRDTLVQGYGKINAAYHKGPENLRDVVSDMLGIPIDYYVTASVKGFIALVDEVGGVDFNIPIHMGYYDPTQELSIFYEPGMTHLNGQQAMEVCRFRHSNDGSGSEYSDIGRTQTQQQVLSLIVKKVLSNPQKIGKYIEIFSQYVKSDMPLETMLWFAEPALGFDLSTGLQSATLPGDPDVRYQGSRWHYQLYPDQTLDILNGFLNPYTTPMTQDMLNIFEAA